MNESRELLAVARELIADEYPMGMSEKGKAALETLKRGIEAKSIFNVDYEEVKRILNRDFEKSDSQVVFDQGLRAFLYHASYSLLGLNNIGKYARDVRAFIKTHDTKMFFPNPAFPREQTEVEKKVVENWDHYASESEKYLRGLETWIPVYLLIKEAKPFIVKGRKPVEHPPGWEPRVYVPPMPGAQAVSLVKAKLEEIVEAQRGELTGKIVKSVVARLEAIPSGTYDELKKAFGEDVVSYRNYYDVEGYRRDAMMKLKANYQSVVQSSVERDVQDMVERYVIKNTGKVAPIVHAKGEPKEVRVHWGSLQGWGFAGEMRFEFADGAGFTVRNQAVWKSTYSGSSFVQFPTTFHDVRFKNGSVKSMVPEQAMNEVWAKEV